jgi:hypothetical protein
VSARRVLALLAAALALAAVPALAHENRPGFLEMEEKSPGVYAFLWKAPFGGETEIHIAPVLPNGCALATPDRQQLTTSAILVRGTLRCEGGLEGKTIVIEGLESTATDVLIRLKHADGRL